MGLARGNLFGGYRRPGHLCRRCAPWRHVLLTARRRRRAMSTAPCRHAWSSTGRSTSTSARRAGAARAGPAPRPPTPDPPAPRSPPMAARRAWPSPGTRRARGSLRPMTVVHRAPAVAPMPVVAPAPVVAQAPVTEAIDARRIEVHARGAARPARSGAASDDVLQVVEERLDVGKRAVSRGKVRLHSLRGRARGVRGRHPARRDGQHRPAHAVDRPVAALGADAFKERTIELEEVDEEAVVAKTARVVEEIGIRKDVNGPCRKPSATPCAPPRSTSRTAARWAPGALLPRQPRESTANFHVASRQECGGGRLRRRARRRGGQRRRER